MKKFIIAAVVCLFITNVKAGIEIFSNRVTGSQIASFQKSVNVMDDKLDATPGTFTNKSILDLVTIGINPDALTITPNIDWTIQVRISYYDAAMNFYTEEKDFLLSYSQTGSVSDDNVSFQFTDARSIKAEILEITDNVSNNNVLFQDVPQSLYLETKIIIDRVYELNTSVVPDVNVEESDYEIGLHWNYVIGAEEYELEWAFVDNYDRTDNEIQYNFNKNSTRITTKNNFYNIPLVYEQGYVLFRIRTIGRMLQSPDVPVYGVWSLSGSGNISGVPSASKYLVTAHEQEKNWQYQAVFAENGKRKESLAYYDGTFRNRQSLTRLDSKNTVIGSETIYDHYGRPAIEILPVPLYDYDLKYYPGLALNNNASPSDYNRNNFDTDASICETATEPLNTASGAANYYSPDNLIIQDPQNPFYQDYLNYIPDANGYPFIQKEFTPDNTGRTSRVTIPGEEFKLGLGHETRFFYDQPGQVHLSRLFGSEAGRYLHYKRTISIDPNGQKNVSYTNLSGKVIATSLIGDNPLNLSELESGLLAEVNLTEQMIGGTPKEDGYYEENVIVNDNSLVYTKPLYVAKAGLFDFEYTFEPLTYANECMTDGICFNCVYDLDITITDECGNKIIPGYTETGDYANDQAYDENGVYTGTNFGYISKKAIGSVFPVDVTCDEPVTFSITPSPLRIYLTEGVYYISKTLSINKDALLGYRDEYLKPENNECILPYDTYLTGQNVLLSVSDCDVNCEDCLNTLGSLEDFIALGGTEEQYNTTLIYCNSLCEEYTDFCFTSYLQLLHDVSPNGQYGQYDALSPDFYFAENYPVSVFCVDPRLPKNGVSTSYSSWKFPVFIDSEGLEHPEYRDDDGSRSLIELLYAEESGNYYPEMADEGQVVYVDGQPYTYPENLKYLKDFINNWRYSWAKSLVCYHPEYCYYKSCIQNAEVIEGYNVSSNQFDYELITKSKDEFALKYDIDYDFVISWFLNKDPYFHEHYNSGNPDEYYDLMYDKLTHYQAGTNYNIFQMAGVLAYCSTIYSPNTSDFIDCLNSYASANSCNFVNSSCITGNEEGWRQFASLYYSAKQYVQQVEANDYAIDCGGYNGCIGVAPDEFTPLYPYFNHELGFEEAQDITTDNNQVCYWVDAGFYAGKEKRFKNNVDDILADDEAMESFAAQVSQDYYSVTGQCPITAEITGLFNKLAVAGVLLQTSPEVELKYYSEFTSNLYYAVTPSSTGFIEYKWIPDVDDKTVEFDIFSQSSDICSPDLVLYVPDVDAFSFTSTDYTITGFRNLRFLDQDDFPGRYYFEILALLHDNLTNDDVPVVKKMYGWTCIDISSCPSPVQCDASGNAKYLMSLMSSLVYFDDFNSTSGTAVTGTSYEPHLAPLQAYLGVGQWYWKESGSGEFQIYDNLSSNINKIIVTFTNTSYDFSGVQYFSNIKPVEGEAANYFEITAHTSSGTDVLTGMVTFYDGQNNEFPIGECQALQPTACQTPEYKRLVDLLPLLNRLIPEDAFDVSQNPDIQLNYFPEFTPLLRGNLETNYNTFWTNVAVSNDNLTITADIASSNPAGEVACPFTFTFTSPNPAFGFEDITEFTQLYADENEPEKFLIQAHAVVSGIDRYEYLTGSSCYELQNCNNCPPEAEDLPGFPSVNDCETAYALSSIGGTEQNPLGGGYHVSFEDYCTNYDCVAAYEQYYDFLTTKGVDDVPAYYLSLSDFCNNNLGDCVTDYIEYLDDISTPLSCVDPVSLENTGEPWFISLLLFCENNITGCASNYINFYYAMIKINFDACGSLTSVYDFCHNNLNDCGKFENIDVCDYETWAGSDYLQYLYLDKYICSNSMPIHYYCEGGYTIPSCEPHMQLPVLDYSSDYYDTSCEDYMVDLANYNALQQYNSQLVDLSDAFEHEYTDSCLKLIENFKVTYPFKEHHFTLYYYDQAGNLIKTVPPQGVQLCDFATDGGQISTDLYTGSHDYFTQHSYVSRYEYNSLNQLIRQSTPDTDPIEANETALLDNGIDPQHTLQHMQFTGGGNGFIIASDGSSGYVYQTIDNGQHWSVLTLTGTENLNAVQHYSSTVAYAAGNKGTVLKSADDGLTWSPLTVNTYEDLNAIFFADDDNGMVAGTNGAIFITADGGQSWSQVTGVTGDVKSIALNASLEGIALVQKNDEARLYRVINSGYSWIFNDNVYTTPISLSIPMPETGYMTDNGGNIFVTNDNGHTWKMTNAANTLKLSDLYFHSDDYNKGLALINNELSYTPDAGVTWNDVNPTGEAFLNYSFAGNTDGFAVNTDGTKLYKTTDGGQTWGNPVTGLSLGEFSRVFFENTSTGFVFGETIKGTADGGSSWTAYSIPTGLSSISQAFFHTVQGTTSAVVIGNGELYYSADISSSGNWAQKQSGVSSFMALSFASATGGYALAGDGSLYYTTDGGSTWQAGTEPVPGITNSFSVFCTKNNTVTQAVDIYAGDGTKLWLSSNQGENWVNISAVKTPQINAVSYNSSSTRAWAAGSNGVVLASDDGGFSWTFNDYYTRIGFRGINHYANYMAAVGDQGNVMLDYNGQITFHQPASGNLNSVAVPGASHVYATGDGGTVALTTNWGSSWSEQQTSPAENLAAVSFITTTEGYIAGQNGKIYKTADGTTFQCLNLATFPVLNASFMFDAVNGYAAGNGGSIYKTADGGKTWTPVTSGTTANFTALWFTDENTGYFLTDNQDIYFTPDACASFISYAGAPSGIRLNDMRFSGLNGLYVGDYGVYSYTDDGGTSWGSIPGTFSNYNLNHIAFITGLEVLVVGDGGKIFISNGSGGFCQNWTDQSANVDWGSVTPVNLNSAYFTDYTTGYAIGDGGVVLKTTDKGLHWGLLDAVDGNTNLNLFAFDSNGNPVIAGNNPSGDVLVYALENAATGYSSRFWYDELGRLVLSQNAKQFEASPVEYSYTVYDKLGRTTQAGLVANDQSLAEVLSNGLAIYSNYLQWLGNGERKEVTRTFYDRQYFDLSAEGFSPVNLRNRVACVTYDEADDDNNENTFDNATHYSYDIHGNVKSLLQYNKNLPAGQQYKKIDYIYDLVSGNVNEVKYQDGQPDAFYQRYEYDADNRITNVWTTTVPALAASGNTEGWTQDAKYFYYDHGPLARTELGNSKVQGIDYAYTLQGWVKGVNSESLEASRDIGKDGDLTAGNINKFISKDAFGYSVGYFGDDPITEQYTEKDYSGIGGIDNFMASTSAAAYLQTQAPGLYNGNISSVVTTIKDIDPQSTTFGDAMPQLSAYGYDQLNRLKTMKAHSDISIENNAWGADAGYDGSYETSLSYDANGNILSMDRNGTSGEINMDALDYKYENIANGYDRNTNRLRHVNDNLLYTGNYDTDVDDQGTFSVENENYAYDKIGNLTKDNSEGIETIEWTASGKVKRINRGSGSLDYNLEYTYDAMGQRIAKVAKPQATLNDPDTWITTFYIKDAQGNPLAVYEQTQQENFSLKERYIYGSSRLGSDNNEVDFNNPATGSIFTATIGNRSYELTNFRGDVLSVVTDKKAAVEDTQNPGTIAYNEPQIITTSDMYPFGMQMPGRNYNSNQYEFGFNGKLKDDEITGVTGANLDFGAREYESRICRWMSPDPKRELYPSLSPYSAFGLNPLYYTDPGGETLKVAMNEQTKADIWSLVGPNADEFYKSQITITNDGEVQMKAELISAMQSGEPDPEGSAGVRLLYNLVSAKETYYYEATDDAVGNGVHYPLTKTKGGFLNLSTTQRVPYNKSEESNLANKSLDKPVDGQGNPVDAQVNIAINRDFTSGTDKNERPSAVFHELWESWERTTNKLPYEYPQYDIYDNAIKDGDMPGKYLWDPFRFGAHDKAVKAEGNFFKKSDTPGAVKPNAPKPGSNPNAKW